MNTEKKREGHRERYPELCNQLHSFRELATYWRETKYFNSLKNKGFSLALELHLNSAVNAKTGEIMIYAKDNLKPKLRGKNMTRMKLQKKSFCLSFAFFLFVGIFSNLFFIAPAQSAEMDDYCLMPPYVKRDVATNIMLQVDNSHDMLAPAHLDATYCPSRPGGNDNCWNSSTNAYYDEYLGHFPPKTCYNPDVGKKFKYTQNVDYTTYTYTGCPAGEFNGNVLNWATMSRYTIAKKVLTGEASTSANSPFEIEGDDALWTAAFGNNYRDSDGCRWTITSSSSDVLSLNVTQPGAPGSCKYPYGPTDYDVIIDPTPGIEVRTGILQEFTDVSPADFDFDASSPRFGLTIFDNSGPDITETIPPNNFEPFINAVKTMNTRSNNELADQHKAIVEYFKAPNSDSDDPYKGCANWEPVCKKKIAVPCRKSFIVMITTGTNVTGSTYVDADLPSACSTAETRPLVRNACYANNEDLRDEADMEPIKQTIETHVIHTFGSTVNQQVLEDTATQGGGSYYSAGGNNLDKVLRSALQDLLKRASAGTAASVLASGEGSGANIIQAIFYPRRKFGNDEIGWTGVLHNLWYFVDPLFSNASIRENTADAASEKVLNLQEDYVAQLYFDSAEEQTEVELWEDTDGDGDGDNCKFGPMPGGTYSCTTVSKRIEDLINLWGADKELWNRDLSASPRTVKTWLDNDSDGTVDSGEFIDFSTGNAGTIKPWFDLPTTDGPDLDTNIDGDLDLDGDVDNDDASILIRYVHGEDFSSYGLRTRSVSIAGVGPKVWKLGDIINSTARVSSWVQLNTYNELYNDTSYSSYINETVDTAGKTAYKNRGMVFVGGNDGMLHALKLGKLELSWTGQGAYDKAKLTGTDLGKEMWAYIPKNTLPYLKYLTDFGYCHIYSVDLSPYLFDASVCAPGSCPGNYWEQNKTVSSWRTILVGGMRYGGACRDATGSCNSTTDGLPDCVKTPVSGNGFSSYFAFDITDQNNPTLLWEFSNADLGFTTTGPSIVRIADKNGALADNSKNGRWLVVFGSGPTGPITGVTSNEYQFLGRSDQDLKLFILDLKTGALIRTIDTNISNAFAGSMYNATNDLESSLNTLDYQDDVIYIPYVKKASSGSTWTDGGVISIITKEDEDPANWVWKKVIEGVGPVTSAVSRLVDKKNGITWLYFATGRYFYETALEVDDADSQRNLFGIKDPCFSSSGLDTSCATIVSSSDLTDQTTITAIANPNSSTFKGWYIDLDPSTSSLNAERVITDPFATTIGIVFFTSYKPYASECSLGGATQVWATKWNTGGAPGTLLKGKVLLQVSTGAIEQIDLATAFTEKGGRRTAIIEGVPPTAQGMAILTPPPPTKSTIHMKER
jgi:type IV pilus assembly protein PilY1